MDDNKRDKFEGLTQNKKGEAKETLGDIRNDEDQRAEGQADQAGGKLKKNFADAKDAIKGAPDELKK